MPRAARELSKSGIYHIILRGTNRQEIFHDDDDCIKFLLTLDRYKIRSGFSLYCWCLMGNHVHFVLREGNEALAVTMKRICVSYAWFYNRKYFTTGHLFQNRYGSENIENNGYLIAATRYIHWNPVKAGIVKRPGDWRWSSYQAYIGCDSIVNSLLDRDFIPSLYSEDRNVGVINLLLYNGPDDDDNFLEDTVKVRYSDQDAREEIIKVIGDLKITSVKSLPKVQRDELLVRIKSIRGISQRQISRILGIPVSLVNRAR